MVFSHQRGVVFGLAPYFREVVVLTCDSDLGPNSELPNLVVKTIDWKKNARVRSALRFFRIALPILISPRKSVVFSHMTDVQSFLIGPLCRMMGHKHFLWYAHKNKSKYLKFVYPFLDGLVSSTKGSCPIIGKKVFLIGQSVDVGNSSPQPPQLPPLRWYHVGRIDPSKRIELIIKAIASVRGKGWPLTLDLYGAPSSDKNNHYLNQLHVDFREFVESGWLRFNGPVQSSDLKFIAESHDGFVHAFEGSLDKSLVEAVLFKRPVATLNSEFHKEFNSPSKSKAELSLADEIDFIINMQQFTLQTLLAYNFQIAKTNHSLDNWLNKLSAILLGRRLNLEGRAPYYYD